MLQAGYAAGQEVSFAIAVEKTKSALALQSAVRGHAVRMVSDLPPTSVTVQGPIAKLVLDPEFESIPDRSDQRKAFESR